ncbi:MAG TPA: DUF2334 domain-containing protein, partial [Polyangiaceae bacterium]|nr:DUF2334 domain-containing protein [Polyangiaceae bacterium]
FEAVAVVGDGVALRPAERFDAIFAVRLAGYRSEAERAFRTALRACRVLGVLGATGATAAPSERLLGVVPTADGVLQLYRGDLTDPLLRIDDYPTGVRPILEDLSSLHEVLERVDESGLDFHLGIVPAIVEARMEEFLRSLQHLVVSQHGFEHGYAKFSKQLLDAGDPFNQRGTVGGFDEFADASFDEIVAKLSEGRRLLEARTGRTPLSYIPPTNRANRRTGRALEACGFEYVLSENPVGACALPCIGSDFYDRSSKFVSGSAPAVASLHATWEADLWRDGDRESLPRFLASLVAQREQARALVAATTERVVTELSRA